MKTFICLGLASIPSTLAWNYSNAGSDWSAEYASCGNQQQSPINLPLTAASDNMNFAVAAPSMEVSSNWN